MHLLSRASLIEIIKSVEAVECKTQRPLVEGRSRATCARLSLRGRARPVRREQACRASMTQGHWAAQKTGHNISFIFIRRQHPITLAAAGDGRPPILPHWRASVPASRLSLNTTRNQARGGRGRPPSNSHPLEGERPREPPVPQHHPQSSSRRPWTAALQLAVIEVKRLGNALRKKRPRFCQIKAEPCRHICHALVSREGGTGEIRAAGLADNTI